MTDRLDLTHALERAGIARDAAEGVADQIFAAIRENVATKQDVAELRTEIANTKADILKWMFAQTIVTIGGLAALFHLLH
jgi:hypothetical protein